MKKTLVLPFVFVFILVAFFMFIIVACNNTNETTETTTDASISSNTSTDANTSSTSNNNVVTDEKSKEFMTKVANSGMAEVQMAKDAQQKATIDAVKSYAAMLERDHTAVGDQIKSFASQRNVALPTSISADKQKMMDDMNKMTGKSFDKDYINMMIKSHNDGIKLFEDTRDNATDVDIKNFADKTLPTLKMHLDSAKAIQKRYW